MVRDMVVENAERNRVVCVRVRKKKEKSEGFSRSPVKILAKGPELYELVLLALATTLQCYETGGQGEEERDRGVG